MDFRFTEEQERFRREVRDFLEEELKKGSFKPSVDAWMLKEDPILKQHVAERGWLGITWPREYGGHGKGYVDRFIMYEEFMRYGASISFYVGDRQIGPGIIEHGSEEQKRFFLPRILKNQIRFCVGMSEPEAGSDLSNIKTRAVEDGDSFIINGQKLWTSEAHLADYCYALVKTNFNPAIPKHRACSDIIIDLKLPGVTIRPVIDMTDGHMWNEVFFDNVRVPKTALVGKKDQGFYQHMSQLDNERAGIERLMANYYMLTKITRYAKDTKRNGKPLFDESWVRHALSDLYIKLEVGRTLIYRMAWVIDHPEASTDKLAKTRAACIAKAFGTKLEQEIDKVCVRIAGPFAQLREGSKWAPLEGMVGTAWAFSPAHTIQGGTHEILLNIIATRGLGLPSE